MSFQSLAADSARATTTPPPGRPGSGIRTDRHGIQSTESRYLVHFPRCIFRDPDVGHFSPPMHEQTDTLVWEMMWYCLLLKSSTRYPLAHHHHDRHQSPSLAITPPRTAPHHTTTRQPTVLEPPPPPTRPSHIRRSRPSRPNLPKEMQVPTNLTAPTQPTNQPP